MKNTEHEKNSLLVDKINKIIRDRGDIDLLMKLDRVVEKTNESDKVATLSEVVSYLNSTKIKSI